MRVLIAEDSDSCLLFLLAQFSAGHCLFRIVSEARATGHPGCPAHHSTHHCNSLIGQQFAFLPFHRSLSVTLSCPALQPALSPNGTQRPKEMEKFARDYTMIQKEPRVERPLPGFLRFTSLASIIPFTRDSGMNGAAAHSGADETSQCKQDPLLGLLYSLGIVSRVKHDHRPSPLPAQLCQET